MMTSGPACGGFGVGKRVVGHAVGRTTAGLMCDAELLENLDCVLHGVPVAAGTHDDADLDGFHGCIGGAAVMAQLLAMDGTDFFPVPHGHRVAGLGQNFTFWALVSAFCRLIDITREF